MTLTLKCRTLMFNLPQDIKFSVTTALAGSQLMLVIVLSLCICSWLLLAPLMSLLACDCLLIFYISHVSCLHMSL